MDFSHAGYMDGGVELPDVPAVLMLTPSGGDDRAALQNAVDAVAANALSNGFRGALVLGAGTFLISGQINIDTRGVVVRGAGSGDGGTVIQMTADSPMTLFNIVGKEDAVEGSPVGITNTYIASGAVSFDVSDASGLSVGDNVFIDRPVTEEWISYMGMDTLVRDGTTQTWITAGSTITTDRMITDISGTRITLDAPLTDTFDSRYLGNPVGTLKSYMWTNRLSHVGLEHLKIEAPPVAASYVSVNMDKVRDSWVRDVVIQDGVNCFVMGKQTKRITVDEVTIQHTVSSAASAPPADFSCTGTQILFNKCRSLGAGSWPFVTQSAGTGPIVLLSFYSTQTAGISPHQRWTTGILADHCDLPNAPETTQGISYRNRRTAGSGQGWTTGWSVAWDVTTPYFLVSAAPGTTNWCIGGIGTRTSETEPDGAYDSLGSYISLGTTGSLYLEQLRERLGNQALANIGYGEPPAETDAWVLLSDDLSTLNNFSNLTVTAGVSWETDGTNAVFVGGDGAGDRARLVSNDVFDFNPGGLAYGSVALEFTAQSDSATARGFEVGLIKASDVGYYNTSLSTEVNVVGSVVSLTSADNPAGLVFNDAVGTAPGAAAVETGPETGEHSYRIVFTASGTELFLDGVTQGTATNVLDFSTDYKIVVFGQGYSSLLKALCAVQLDASMSQTLLLDDLSTLCIFTNDYNSVANVSWETDGTNAVYAGGGSAGDRARLTSLDSFDLNPGGTAYDSVTLEFTTQSGSATSDRFEVGLIDVTDVSKYNNPLSFKTDVCGAVVCHTSTANSQGLLFNDATGVAPGSVADVAMAAVIGKHSCKIVFTAAGTELFQDGVSQGTTAKTLDFTKDYKLTAFGQGYSSTLKSLCTVRLTAGSQPLLVESCSTFGNFQNVTHLDAFWLSDGTNMIYDNNGAYSANRATLYSKTDIDFNPEGMNCEFVLLQFTSTISDVGTSGANRLEVGLVSSDTIEFYDDALSSRRFAEGAVISHTDDINPVGLVFNHATGTAPGSGAVKIFMEKKLGTHRYTVVFSTTGTSLFQDGVFQGSTTNALDFTKDYKLAAFGQDDTSEKKLCSLSVGTLLPVVEKENVLPLSIDSISLEGGSLLINVVNAQSGTTYKVFSSTDMMLPLSQWVSVASSTPKTGSFCVTNFINSNDTQRFYIIRAQETDTVR
ncbi:MAG: hypothetical protein AB7E95_00540 [Kiritimatiellales bacterium]